MRSGWSLASWSLIDSNKARTVSHENLSHFGSSRSLQSHPLQTPSSESPVRGLPSSSHPARRALCRELFSETAVAQSYQMTKSLAPRRSWGSGNEDLPVLRKEPLSDAGNKVRLTLV